MRLLLMKHQINLFCIPALFIQLLIAANLSGYIPSLVCFSLEIIDTIVTVNSVFSGFLVVLGRYIYKNILQHDTGSAIHFSRLFYLYQDSVQKYIKEESLFACLSCINYVFSGIVTSMMIGEVYINFNESHTLFFWYSSCSQIPWGAEAWSYDMQMVAGISIIFITFGLNIALFVRKRQLETIRAEGIMVVNYSHDDVTISRRKEDEPSCHKLNHFNRTVVTPKASFILFLTNALDYIILIFIHLNETPSGLPVFGELIYFLTFSYIFFFNTLIETIFSPCLRNSIIDILPCHRPAYAVCV